MADIFISFKTDDTPRVQAIYDGFRARGLTVFWSNDIPAGAPNYQAIIKDELLKAPVAVVVWTNFSVHSGPVVQECTQAERANKLFQILLDDIEPIDMPMEVKFKAQKTMLLGWTGNRSHSEWIKLNSAIDAKLGRKPVVTQPPAPPVAASPALAARGSQPGAPDGGGFLDKVKAFVAGQSGGQAPAAPAARETRAVARPAWASAAGQDKFGPWAEFALSDARQRMRWIEPGAFQMGSPEGEAGRWDDEGPRHEVRLTKGFWLGDTPVTQALWTAAMGNNPSYFKDPKRPVETVSWDDAQQFLIKMNTAVPGLGLSLPTEAQWEYACRAGTKDATYAGPMQILGDNNAPVLDGIAWYGGNSGVGFELGNGYDSSSWPGKQHNHSRAGSHPVALKRPNDWGLYDMLGNVWEWCADGRRSYTAKPVTDPAGPLESASRALRGGSWYDSARHARAANRRGYDRGDGDLNFGFRCCA
ncbi:MAG: SUMF1/EgtB/PvdO family nonheme iron enzyme [Rhodomicrobium sp.]